MITLFLRHGPSMFHVADDVPSESEALQASLDGIKTSNEKAQHDTLKSHYKAAMSDLHNVPDVQLLERVSAALGDNAKHLVILQSFHALSFNLLKASDVDNPSELKAAPDMEDDTAD